MKSYKLLAVGRKIIRIFVYLDKFSLFIVLFCRTPMKFLSGAS